MSTPDMNKGSPYKISQSTLAARTSPPCSLTVCAALGLYFSRTTSGSLTVNSTITYALMRILLSWRNSRGTAWMTLGRLGPAARRSPSHPDAPTGVVWPLELMSAAS
jgi:hypothetical protein